MVDKGRASYFSVNCILSGFCLSTKTICRVGVGQRLLVRLKQWSLGCAKKNVESSSAANQHRAFLCSPTNQRRVIHFNAFFETPFFRPVFFQTLVPIFDPPETQKSLKRKQNKNVILFTTKQNKKVRIDFARFVSRGDFGRFIWIMNKTDFPFSEPSDSLEI